MATRTVRLDKRDEQVLEQIVRLSGLPVSSALKRGLLALRRELDQKPERLPYEVYQELDLGDGGWSIASAKNTRRGVREALRRKHGK